jgi:carbon storage regulator CsrA
MLVLSRRLDERVIITTPDGYRCVVQVVDVTGDPAKVRLGFVAPREVTIHRENVQAELERRRIPERADGWLDGLPDLMRWSQRHKGDERTP